MMRLFIEGRQVDLAVNEELLVTREIADIREPMQRTADWSKTYVIPGTSANNKLFGHIFDINQEQINTGTQFAPDFNPNKKATAWVTVSEMEMVRGFVRLLNINVVRKGEIEYEISFHGVLADMFTKLGLRRLEELEFSEYNHILSKTAIKNSWANASGYVYPMINLGRDPDSIDTVWGVEEFRPAIFAKQIVDKIFAEAGYSYTSDSFFNSDFFKKLVVPFPSIPELDDEALNGREALANIPNTDRTVAKNAPIIFDTEVYDNGGNYNPASGQYTSPAGGAKYLIDSAINVQITGLNHTTYPNISALFGVYSNNKFVEGFSTGYMTNTASGAVAYDIGTYMAEIGAGDGHPIDIRLVNVYSVQFGQPDVVIPSGYTTTILSDLTAGFNTYFKVTAMRRSYGLGQTVDFNSFFVSGNWTMRDFIYDLMKMFNLYAEPTDKTAQLFIAPRDDFYRNTITHDLTAKIDMSEPLEIIPMGELEGNPYVLTYTAGTDFDSKDYLDTTGVTYGEARYFLDNDFVKNENKISVGFASTPYVNSAGGKIRIASIENDDQRTGQLRLLYWSGKVSDVVWELCDEFTGSGWTNREQITGGYPHAGHLDSPFTPTIDLNFGMPFYINLPGGITYTNNNLFNKYWRKYMKEITDRNSRIVRCKVYITPADWAKWSFRDLFFFGGQFFRLNKIEDYAIGSSELTRCEFLKIKESAVFVPSTQDPGKGWDSKDDNNDRWPDLQTRKPGKKRRFVWTTTGGSSGGGKGPIYDMTQGIKNLTQSDIGIPGENDTYKVIMEWAEGDFRIKLEKQ